MLKHVYKEEEITRLMQMKGKQFIKSHGLYRKLAREILDTKKLQ